MANYYGVSRTNYFRVTDEQKYQELFSRLCGEDKIDDFTKTLEDGTLCHGFGSYCSIDYMKPIQVEAEDPEDSYEDYECDFDAFCHELQKILPEDEAFIYLESGYEKLRYVVGYYIVVTAKEIRSSGIEEMAIAAASDMLGKDFKTKVNY